MEITANNGEWEPVLTRIILTGEMLTLVFQGFDNDLGNNIGVFNTSKDEEIQKIEEQLQQQILDDYEFVENYNKPYKMRITYDKLEQENEQLKDSIEDLKKSDCVSMVQTERSIRKSTENKYEIVLNDYRNLKQKLDEIEKLVDYTTNQGTIRQIQKILKESKS